MKYDVEKAISILERTPLVLKTLLEGLDTNWTHTNEGEKTWSPYDVIGHLIHGENTDWIPRAKIIISDIPNKTFEPYDRFAQFTNNKGESLITLLDTFAQLREKNIRILRSLEINSEDLEKKGMHPELGEVTLENLLAAWVVHDLGHITQISRTMAKQYKNEVGPWPQYLAVLNA